MLSNIQNIKLGKAGKVVLTVVAGIAIFAIGVQYSDQVVSFVHGVKNKFFPGVDSDALPEGEDEASASQLTNKIADALVLGVQNPVVYAVGTHRNNKSGKFYTRIRVKDDRAIGFVKKYLAKNELQDRPVAFEIGDMAVAGIGNDNDKKQ